LRSVGVGVGVGDGVGAGYPTIKTTRTIKINKGIMKNDFLIIRH